MSYLMCHFYTQRSNNIWEFPLQHDVSIEEICREKGSFGFLIF